jgi:hypothetical protein
MATYVSGYTLSFTKAFGRHKTSSANHALVKSGMKEKDAKCLRHLKNGIIVLISSEKLKLGRSVQHETQITMKNYYKSHPLHYF